MPTAKADRSDAAAALSVGDEKSTTSKSKPRSPPTVPTFVAFNANSTDASRKTVRKQAALASAATRKATIAKKREQQKKKQQQDEQQQGPTSAPSGGETQAAPIPDQTSKRKRVSSSPTPERAVKSSTNPLDAVTLETLQEKKLKSDPLKILSGYLSPLTTDGGAKSHHSPPGNRGSTPEPCQCFECTVLASGKQQARLHLIRRYSTGSSDTSCQSWPVAREECRNSEATSGSLITYSNPNPIGISGGRIDPFNCYPVEYHPLYDDLLHHMLKVFAPRGWPALRITNKEGLHWEWFMTQHALAEPALFLVRCLFASGDMIRLGVLESEVSWWLRSKAIQAINDALSDDQRSISDGLILAVGRIALNESLYGDKVAASTIHRPAQRRMIDLRGGMQGLPFPQLVKRLMRWSDRVMSLQTNTKRLLPDEEDQGNASFNTEQSVSVLENWAPSEGKALRKKITVADLVT